MSYFIIALIIFMLLVGSIVGAVMLSKSDVYANVKTDDNCTAAGVKDKKAKTCGLWEDDDKVCYKGKCTDDSCIPGDCEKDGDMRVLGLLIGSVVLFMLFVLFIVLGFINKGSKKSNMFAYSSCGSQ